MPYFFLKRPLHTQPRRPHPWTPGTTPYPSGGHRLLAPQPAWHQSYPLPAALSVARTPAALMQGPRRLNWARPFSRRQLLAPRCLLSPEHLFHPHGPAFRLCPTVPLLTCCVSPGLVPGAKFKGPGCCGESSLLPNGLGTRRGQGGDTGGPAGSPCRMAQPLLWHSSPNVFLLCPCSLLTRSGNDFCMELTSALSCFCS